MVTFGIIQKIAESISAPPQQQFEVQLVKHSVMSECPRLVTQ